MKKCFFSLILCLSFVIPINAQLFGGHIKPKRYTPISDFVCESATFSKAVFQQNANYIGTLTIPYTGGDGSSYPAATYTSTGNTSFTAELPAGTLATGNGNLVLNITGTSSTLTEAVFNIAFGGQTCSIPFRHCGAFVASGVYKPFQCHNLGADTSFDPDVPVQDIFGNYYQWGRITVVATSYTGSGSIAGWNTSSRPLTAWQDNTKTTNDPCPDGFKVPTSAQWQGVVNTSLNTVSRTGANWTASATNFNNAIHFGPSTTVRTLTLPINGLREEDNGSLFGRGNIAWYWSSSNVGNAGYGGFAVFTFTTASAGGVALHGYGASVRCVQFP